MKWWWLQQWYRYLESIPEYQELCTGTNLCPISILPAIPYSMAFSPDTFGVVFRAGSAQLDRDPCQKRDPTATATATAILHAAIFLAVLAVIQAFGSFRFRSEKVPNLQAKTHFSDHYKLQNMSVPMVHPWGVEPCMYSANLCYYTVHDSSTQSD